MRSRVKLHLPNPFLPHLFFYLYFLLKKRKVFIDFPFILLLFLSLFILASILFLLVSLSFLLVSLWFLLFILLFLLISLLFLLYRLSHKWVLVFSESIFFVKVRMFWGWSSILLFERLCIGISEIIIWPCWLI